MKVIRLNEIIGSERQVKCPNGGFISNRFLLESDGMGYSITKTIVPRGEPQHWHYKHHFESCYCIKGKGILTNLETGKSFIIQPDTVYVLDKNDDHTFEAIETTELICVFNPPLMGREVHQEDGSYVVVE